MPDNPSLTPDSEILKKFNNASTKEEGFNLLIKKFRERIFWQIRRLVTDHEDANDVIQEVFLKVWKNLHQFRSDSQLYTWLYRIAINEALNFIKQKKKRYSISIEDEESNLAGKLRADKYFEGDELAIKLQQAIFLLPEKQKEVFTLRYYDELKYEEMSEMLGTSVGALKASYHHAVKKIEEYITGH